MSRRAVQTTVLLVAGAGGAWAGGLAPDLRDQIRQRPDSTQKVRVIVRFATRGVAREAFARAFGGVVKQNHPFIDGVTLELPQKAVEALSRRADVSWVSPDRPVGAQWDCDTKTIGA